MQYDNQLIMFVFGVIVLFLSPSVLGLSTKNSMATGRGVLYDMPVSNNGARCRIILYKKDVNDIIISQPSELGGLQSESYKAISPLGKMPAFVSASGDVKLCESDTIARYFMSVYKNVGPTFQPDNPQSNMMARIHDMYMTTIQVSRSARI
jgi:glutathione S-transferase